MKKPTKIIILCITVFIVCGLFAAAVQAVKKAQSELGQEQERKTVEDYKTGKILTISDIYQEIGLKKAEIHQIAFEFAKNANMEDIFHSTYFVSNADSVKKIIDIVEHETFEVSAVSSNLLENMQLSYQFWIGIDEERAIYLSVYTTSWENINLCHVMYSKLGNNLILDDDFMFSYMENGFFISDALQKELMSLVKTKIPKITLEDAKNDLEQKENVKLSNFQHYLYEDLEYTGEEVGDIQKYPLADGSGYLKVYFSLDRQNAYQILKVEHCDNQDKVVEVLYEHME